MAIQSVNAQGATRELGLVNIPNRVHDAVEHGMRRATAASLAMAEAWTEKDLTGVEGFPAGEGLEDYENLGDYEPAANAVLEEIPVDLILIEALMP